MDLTHLGVQTSLNMQKSTYRSSCPNKITTISACEQWSLGSQTWCLDKTFVAFQDLEQIVTKRLISCHSFSPCFAHFKVFNSLVVIVFEGGRMTFASRNVHLAAEVCPCDGWKFKACRSRWGHADPTEGEVKYLVLKNRKVGSNKEEMKEALVDMIRGLFSCSFTTNTEIWSIM